VEWSSTGYVTAATKTRLFNVTDGVVAGVGWAGYGGPEPVSFVGGAPIIAGKTYRLEMRVGATRTTDGLGLQSGFSEIECYSRVCFYRD
jgi:hypothetical protein